MISVSGIQKNATTIGGTPNSTSMQKIVRSNYKINSKCITLDQETFI